ncbi:MAG: NTP transferase domain-containing protein [Myxococcales bacterium]|nr:NTP transferase domain-containing protein [Myxococcales bacterium]
MKRPLVGIFVGGRGTRMGGVAKGLLLAPDHDETLVARLVRVAHEALADPELVLVGAAAGYQELGLESLPDEPAGIGPIGGLSALLAEAQRREAPFALALACDLPYVTASLLTRLASTAPDALAVAARQGEGWQPLCARFEPMSALAVTRGLIADGSHSLQQVVVTLKPAELALEPDDDLRDWDEPSDLPGDEPSGPLRRTGHE